MKIIQIFKQRKKPRNPVNSGPYKLNKAVSEYIDCKSIEGAKPHIIYVNGPGFIVTRYYSFKFITSRLISWVIIK